MEKTISGAVFVIMAFPLFSAQVVAQQTDAQRHAVLLDRLETSFFMDEIFPWYSDSTMKSGTPELIAIHKEGVPILPDLAKRIAGMHAVDRLYTLYWAFRYISHFDDYLYSLKPKEFEGIEYYEPDPARLPFLIREWDAHGENITTQRDKLLAWWEKMQGFNVFAEQTARMRHITAGLTPDGENLSGPVYREYAREFCNYGIFNLPAFITLIKEDNNPLAFLGFLQVSGYPGYFEWRPTGNQLENVKLVVRECPLHEERLALVTNWWAENASQFVSLPALQKAIADAVEKEPKQ